MACTSFNFKKRWLFFRFLSDFQFLQGIGRFTTTNGIYATKTYPIQIGSANNWSLIAAGSGCSVATNTNNTLLGWGLNWDGQVGDGTYTSKNTPTEILIGTFTHLHAGQNYNLTVLNNSALFAWGSNAYGQHGDGTTTTKNIPTLVIYPPIYSGLAGTGNFQNATQGNFRMFNNSCALIASVSQYNNSFNAINGIVSTKVWVETVQPSTFVKRHYQITPDNNASTASGRITLYFTQTEFDNFNVINTAMPLPTNPTDAIGKANLLIEKRSGKSNDGTGLPNTYTGTITTINPTNADIVWNSTNNWWEVTFDVTGFSGFFIKTLTTLLPVQWLSITGNLNNQKQAYLNWKV